VVLVIDTRDIHGRELAKAMGADGSARYLMTCVPAQALDDEEFKVSLVAKADKVNYAIIAHGTTQVFLPSAGSDDRATGSTPRTVSTRASVSRPG